MRTVFSASSLPLAKKFDVGVAVVTFCIFAAIQREAVTAAAADVQCVADEQHPHGFAHRDVQDFLFRNLAVFNRDACDGLFILAAKQQTSFGIFGQTNPGAIHFGIGAQYVLDGEARKRVQNFCSIFKAYGL